ncbi:MAG: GNAT family N-acetyltransferase [Eubacterium sp.]|nr:GNAT family N-acetyltransferase [Eubacterium sp.]
MYTNGITFKYLSPLFVSQRRKSKGFIIAGSIIAGLYAFATIYSLVIPMPLMKAGIEEKMFAPIFAAMIIPGLVLLFIGLAMSRKVNMAVRYEAILSGDKNGIVEIRELTGQTGKSQEAVTKELRKLFQKGFFQGCTLRLEGTPAIVINDAMVGEAGTGFAEVSCPRCGGVTRIRAGSRGQCAYCHAPIEDVQGAVPPAEEVAKPPKQEPEKPRVDKDDEEETGDLSIDVYDQMPDGARVIREAVFMDEQGFENEFDEADETALHFLMTEDERPVATCRLNTGDAEDEYILGRLAVAKDRRGNQFGSELLNEVDDYVFERGGGTIRLHSQCEAQGFYEANGYTAYGEVDEDEGCPHVWMQKEVEGV